MFAVSVETEFRASHQLVLSDGSTEDAHDHNWRVLAEVSSERLNDAGLVMDFERLKSAIDNIVAQFENKPLNTIDYFRRHNPSAENVAKYVYEKLELELPGGLGLEHITVVEEPNCSARFTKGSGRFGENGQIQSGLAETPNVKPTNNLQGPVKFDDI
ncbi:MAG: 6-carboxytetrahydropterin synthase [Phycisphaerales bacterium]|nr:MAG: 6-carboxytetrahydropterin synthase [Phycisphaerales bacterium]